MIKSAASIVFILMVISLLFVSCALSNNAKTSDYEAFLELLTQNGFSYAEGNPDSEFHFLTAERKPVFIGSEILGVYEYESNEVMESDAACVDISGFSMRFEGGGIEISWASNPYFFKKDALMINYVGENDDIINFLIKNFGKPFAGLGAEIK